MSIGTYSELVAEVVDWLDDETLSAKVPNFIQLAEARFRDEIVTLNDDVTGTAQTAAGDSTVALPLRFGEMRSIKITGNRTAVLTQLAPDDLTSEWANESAAIPVNYAIVGSELVFGPTPDAVYDLEMIYNEGITPLSEANPTNWLLTARPDLYLFSTLIFAEARGWNDERLPMLKAGADEMLAGVIAADRRRRRGSQAGDVPAVYF